MDGSVPRRRGMREVAQVAGVSVSTVANAVNHPELVNERTLRRVREAMDEVGFVRSGPARQLRGVESRVVGVVMLDLANPFYAEVGRGIEDRLAEAGCVALTCSTDARPERESWALEMLREQAVRGIVVFPTGADMASLTRISEHGTPVVLVDHRPDAGLCAVTADHLRGGALAAGHLVGLGHRRLAHLTGTEATSSVTDRREGVRQAVAAAGLDPRTALVEVELPASNAMPATDAVVESLMAAPEPPTAIVCLNDLVALGVLHGLRRLGVPVPGRVSVVGYDDLRFAGRLVPALTTVRQPTYDLGRTAAELLLAEDEPGHIHGVTRFEPSLAVRGTTGPV